MHAALSATSAGLVCCGLAVIRRFRVWEEVVVLVCYLVISFSLAEVIDVAWFVSFFLFRF